MILAVLIIQAYQVSVAAQIYFGHCECRDSAGGIDESIPRAVTADDMEAALWQRMRIQ